MQVDNSRDREETAAHKNVCAQIKRKKATVLWLYMLSLGIKFVKFMLSLLKIFEVLWTMYLCLYLGKTPPLWHHTDFESDKYPKVCDALEVKDCILFGPVWQYVVHW